MLFFLEIQKNVLFIKGYKRLILVISTIYLCPDNKGYTMYTYAIRIRPVYDPWYQKSVVAGRYAGRVIPHGWFILGSRLGHTFISPEIVKY